jgi:hypothetical protein
MILFEGDHHHSVSNTVNIAEGFKVSDDIINVQWALIDDGSSLGTVSRFGLDYSALKSWFVIERETAYFEKFVITPGVLVVMLSYCSFWVNYRAIPGRVTLSVLPILTCETQLYGAYSTLPNISYPTWLLRFLTANLVFTVFAMAEFTLVNYLMKRMDLAIARKSEGASGDEKGADTSHNVSKTENDVLRRNITEM